MVVYINFMIRRVVVNPIGKMGRTLAALPVASSAYEPVLKLAF